MQNLNELQEFKTMFNSIGVTDLTDQKLILQNLYQFGNILYYNYFNKDKNYDKKEASNRNSCVQQAVA